MKISHKYDVISFRVQLGKMTKQQVSLLLLKIIMFVQK